MSLDFTQISKNLKMCLYLASLERFMETKNFVQELRYQM